jgi:hypothetical protein
MEEILHVAQSSPVWMFASIVVGIVIAQALAFILLASRAASGIGMTHTETTVALRTGVISSLGPSFGISVVIISLIALLGAPFTLMRIGIIGSAATELTAAGIGANAYGVELGSAGYDLRAFTSVVWTMCLGGCGWLIMAALCTKKLGEVQLRVAGSNAPVMATISLAAMLGAFAYLASQQMAMSIGKALAALAAAATMMLVLRYAKRQQQRWLAEWALGIALIVGMTAGYLCDVTFDKLR